MNQFDLVLKDFVNWKLDNIEVLERFKQHGSLIYDRLEPVYAVINYIYDMAVEDGEMSEDLETIFQVGLNYMHSQFEVIRIYYEKLFDSDCGLFDDFTPLVGYLLFIADFRADLDEFEDELDFSKLNEVETMIEDMIAQKNDNFDYAADKLNKVTKELVEQLDFEYVSIIDIFYEIAENLNVPLSTDVEAFVVGEDI